MDKMYVIRICFKITHAGNKLDGIHPILFLPSFEFNNFH